MLLADQCSILASGRHTSPPAWYLTSSSDFLLGTKVQVCYSLSLVKETGLILKQAERTQTLLKLSKDCLYFRGTSCQIRKLKLLQFCDLLMDKFSICLGNLLHKKQHLLSSHSGNSIYIKCPKPHVKHKGRTQEKVVLCKEGQTDKVYSVYLVTFVE